ncbi:MAG: gliding motility-associated C-terminal domain-containing protein, partial [Chitinophagales bacterium]
RTGKLAINSYIRTKSAGVPLSSLRDEMIHLFQGLFVLQFLFCGVLASAQTGTSPIPAGFSPCVDGTQRILFHEDSLIITANYIGKTRDGNFLIPGYYYGNNGIFYNMPYLIKCSPDGNIIWSKSYPSTGIFPSNWFTATRIKELDNGDLLMTGQIGIPGTDDRRDLAVWRLANNGTLIWATSFENTTWTNPITGSTEVTGIQEDETGNIFLAGNLRFFELPKYAFVLKLDPKGRILWDRIYGSHLPLAYGLLLLQNKLLLIGSSGPDSLEGNPNSNLLWCINMNPDNGDTLNTKAWYANFGALSFANSFAYANTTVGMLDNGLVSVFGTANSDLLGVTRQNQDTINHSIVANFSPDFEFLGGIMLSSRQPANYYNTLVTQQSNGRIAFTRFIEDGNLFNENIVYGFVKNDQTIKERVYQEPNRSATFVSNFLYYPPEGDILVQAYHDPSGTIGGLEVIRMHESDIANICNGNDTSLTFIQPYFMAEGIPSFDTLSTNTFRQTRHNFVTILSGQLTRVTGCGRIGMTIYNNPIVSLDKDSVLCQGATRELDAGQTYSNYSWSDGSTGPSMIVNKTGKYWLSVTDKNGCTGSDTTFISTISPLPASFLPPDTVICQFSKITIQPTHAYVNYLWSDLSSAPELVVSQAGIYRLEVTDSNYCTGSDSILVTQKQCLDDLVVPNAFTPNGDGRNDVFRPIVLENVVHYKFQLFNRWGERIFESNTPMQGWDGKLNGMPAANGVYVWFCQYQPEGQGEKMKKGTVVLIR